MRASRVASLAAAGLLACGSVAADGGLPTRLPASGYQARESDDSLKLPAGDAKRLRKDALARALVWLDPEQPIENAQLGQNPDDDLGRARELACKFLPSKSSGRTPKFECVFENGEVLKVKYGDNPELHTEVAATRLMHALGAGADRMYLVGTVRCFGCPEDPHEMLRCLSSPFEEVLRQCEPAYGERSPEGKLQIKLDYSSYTDFSPVAIERRAEGRAITSADGSGWGWGELDLASPGPREAERARRDALRLLAVFLNNWDNRADNQRLLCLEDGARMADGGCLTPLAYMHDVGGTFGSAGGPKERRKLDVEAWRSAPIWKDRAACRVSIESPSFHGATFGEAAISEGGRAFLVERLTRLSAAQVRALFEGARFAEFPDASPASRDVEQWVRAFQEKVRQIEEGGPCPVPRNGEP